MKMRWLIGAAVLGSVAVAIPVPVIAAGTASAATTPTTPTAFSGGFTSEPTGASYRLADGNIFITVTDSVTFTGGTFDGTSIEQINMVLHPDLSIEFHGSDVCGCTVAGSFVGTIVMRFSGNGVWNGPTIGYISIGHGTGPLANLHGTATFLSLNGGTYGTWSGVYHFAP